MGFDPSYISRIRTGQRRPANVAHLSAQVARFVAFNCTDAPQVERIAALVGVLAHEVAAPEAREDRIREWLASGATAQAQEPSVARPLLRVFTEEKRDEREKALDRLHGAYGDGNWRGGKWMGLRVA